MANKKIENRIRRLMDYRDILRFAKDLGMRVRDLDFEMMSLITDRPLFYVKSLCNDFSGMTLEDVEDVLAYAA